MTATAHSDHMAHDAHGSGDGHDKHAGHAPEMFRDRLWVSLVLTLPIVYFSESIQDWFGFTAASFPGAAWVTPVLASILFVYAGSVFLRGGLREIRDHMPGMMTLISLAISVAYAYSIAVSLGFDGMPFYWELATLLDVMLLGHWMEMKSIKSASTALQHLADMVPHQATRVDGDGGLTEVPVDSLTVGDRILIRPGEQIPADGIVIEGRSSLNESFLTGESRPVSKQEGDEVVAGSVNGEGAITAEVSRTGDDTTLNQIMRLVEEAQASRSRFQALADRAAFWLTVVAIAVAVPTLIGWLAFGSRDTTFAISRTVTVLVIACPHALGLAIPLVTMNATAVSAKNGILVRNREAFERGRGIEFVAFDKTGTLTEGRFQVAAITTGTLSEGAALRAAAALEQSSEHPLAAAIVDAARGTTIEGLGSNVISIPGNGLEGKVDGRHVRVGRPEWVSELDLPLNGDLASALASADDRGESAVVLIIDDTVEAVISLRDQVRDTAPIAVDDLRRAGITPVMITGDAEAVAETVAGELGIDRYYGRVQPQGKARIVADLKSEGPVGFVGDGINDAPALLEADLGVAIGAGTNVAIESADLVLVEDDPAGIARALELSRATHRKMIQNLMWAVGYNVVALPLAAGVAVSAGIILDPAVGALLMSLSTVIVSLNAMLLRRIKLGDPANRSTAR